MNATRLQSSMEYLMTYSWAFLVIALVLVSLFTLGLFNPGAFVNTQCIFPAGLACTNLFIATNGLITLNLLQTMQQPINITALGCNKNNTMSHMSAVSPHIELLIGANYTFLVQCWAGSSTFSNSPGNLFSGFVFINYTDVVTGFSHSATGQIVAKIT